MYYVYIIYSPTVKKHYIGSSEDIARRLVEHNRNIVQSTKNRGPWKVIYTEGFSTKSQAITREHYIKSLKGGNAFKKLVYSVPIV